MSTVRKVDYPSSDGKPVGETVTHRNLLLGLVETLIRHFERDPMVYVSGNDFIYWVEGDPRRSVCPDVWMARGVPKDRRRDIYLVWEEASGPQMVIELTSRKTRREDLNKKFELYRDVLKVEEYFLFDPKGDYLRPPLQGYRLHEGQYAPIPPVAGRLPSAVAGLHLERDGEVLRLFDPRTGRWVPWTWEFQRDADAARLESETRLHAAFREREAAQHEREAAQRAAEEAQRQAEEAQRAAEEAHRQAEEAHRQAEEAQRQAEEAQDQARADRVRLEAALQELARLRQGPEDR